MLLEGLFAFLFACFLNDAFFVTALPFLFSFLFFKVVFKVDVSTLSHVSRSNRGFSPPGICVQPPCVPSSFVSDRKVIILLMQLFFVIC